MNIEERIFQLLVFAIVCFSAIQVILLCRKSAALRASGCTMKDAKKIFPLMIAWGALFLVNAYMLLTRIVITPS
jgi:hypothetical protein